MKFLHTSDLHLGKRLNEFSLIEDQEYILNEILSIAVKEGVDGIIIAGDIYDKSVPSAEAVTLFDRFLVGLSKEKIPVYAISGNHDSAERVAFGGRLMEQSGVYLSPVYDGKLFSVTLSDEFGEADIYLLPFVKPAHVRRYFGDEAISYTDALRLALKEADVSRRCILITHQFVTGASRTESEEISVGGTDNVDASVFSGFDYVALGHLHRPQPCGEERVRYSGTPLKYSFSEANDEKSVTVVTLKGKGDVDVRAVPLSPRRDLTEIKGKYDELVARSYYANATFRENYLHVTLTDEEDVPDAIGKLRTVYPNLMKIDYDNARTRASAFIGEEADVERRTPLQLFEAFFALQNDREMGEEQKSLVDQLIERTWEDEK